jgi:hypothetical protein
MASDRLDKPPTHAREASISERAAHAAQAASHRARNSVSLVVRAREALEFTLGLDKPDVRGWPVYSKEGEPAGVVTSLFIDMRTRTIRYLGVSLQPPRARAAEVLIPIGWASRPDDRQVVVIHPLSLAQLAGAPRVSSRPITRADEEAALTAYGAWPSGDFHMVELYGRPMFDEWRLFGGPGSRAALG